MAVEVVWRRRGCLKIWLTPKNVYTFCTVPLKLMFFVTVFVFGPYTTVLTPDSLVLVLWTSCYLSSLFLVLWTSCYLYSVNCNWWNQEAACLESLPHAFIIAVTSSSKHWQSSTWKHFCYVLHAAVSICAFLWSWMSWSKDRSFTFVTCHFIWRMVILRNTFPT